MRTILNSTFVLCFGFVAAYAQVPKDKDKGNDKKDSTVIVYAYFSGGKGLEKDAQKKSTKIIDPQIRSTFARLGINDDLVRRAYPEFKESDTVARTPKGQIVKRVNYSNLAAIIVKNKTIADEVVIELRKLPFVVYAEQRPVDNASVRSR